MIQKKQNLIILFFLIFTFCKIVPLSAFDFYWEDTVNLSSGEGRFPQSSSGKNLNIVVWEDIEITGKDKGNIWLSAQIANNNENTWKTIKHFAGPYVYSGDVPNIFSVAINKKDVIAIAVKSASQQISSIVSSDGGHSFTSYDIFKTGESLIAPRIYQSANNTFTIFATGVADGSFHLNIARSSDGITWTPFSAFANSSSFTNAFLPTLQVVPTTSDTVITEKDVVVFQAFYRVGEKLSYQLYSTISDDNGITWTEPIIISQMVEANQTFDKFHNQRPNLSYIDNTLFLSWERSYFTSTDTAIYVVPLTSSGIFAETPTKISPANVEAHQPILLSVKDKLSVVWFDNRRGNNCVYFAQKNGYLWEDEQISSSSQTSVFACPVVINQGQDFHVFWEQQLNNTEHHIMRLSQDRSVLPATLIPSSFVSGKRSSSSKANFSVSLPKDSSGVAGYSWIFTRDESQQPPKTFMEFPKKNQISVSATEDGEWFFKVRVLDMAGNWSVPSSLSYFRDTTPPGKPVISLPKSDDDGYLLSNTFVLNWTPPDFNPDNDEIGGYTYSLDYLAPLSSFRSEPDKWNSENLASLKGTVPSRILTQKTENTWYNSDNGVYLFTLAAIDTVGNIGETTSIPIYLNKYIPYTVIWSIDDTTNEFGDISLSLYGKGFTYDGLISEIYIDQDGQAPWDRVLKLTDKDYTIYSDNSIKGITLSDLPEGRYKIGLLHTDRGLYIGKSILPVSEFGTVKIGNFDYRYKPVWKVIVDHYKYSINAGDILLWCLLMFALLGILASFHGLVSTAKEVSMVNLEVKALIQGDTMPLEKQKQQLQLKKLHKRGISLKYKLIFVTSALSLSVILLVSIPLGIYMIDTQQDTLSKGLQDRTAVLLDSLSSGVKAYMPSKDVLEMSFLPKQADSMDDANYVTILGLAANDSDTDLNHVWASNDPDINLKIDEDDLVLGQSRLIGDDIEKIANSCKSLNEKAVEEVQEIANQISQLTKEGIALVSKNDTISIERRSEIQNLINQLKEKLSIDLNKISVEGTGIMPAFDAKKIDRENTTYIAYKPVLFRQGSEQMFVRGIVLVEFTTKNLIIGLDVARQTIINTAIFIGVIAIIIGIIASLFLARIIISPIRRVVESVSIISNTVNKKALGRNPLKITRGDEIGELAESVNRMTNDIQFEAWHKSFLNDGLEVQRAMLPLDVKNGKKQSIGHYEQDNLDIFAFFKGAVTVSGDYFDYRKLDDRYYLLLKADASGHDEGASLVVTDFSAIYIDSFKDWNAKKGISYLSKVVEKINAHLNARNYPGKFVAFTMVLYDSQKGDMYCCNAGDNIMHIYDASEKKNNTIILKETPAAGAIDPYLIEMKGGYPVEKLHLDPGDILFLYSDGIEEEQHKYKDELGNHVAYKVNEKGKGTAVCVPPPEPGEPTGDIEFEEMSTEFDRVNPIINAVLAKKSYTLHRRKNPLEFESKGYDFDFTTCEGTPEEAVMALLAVDFVFRMEKPLGVNEYNTVEQDKKIDKFLSKHFVQYQKYLSKGIEHFDEKLQSEYMLYTELKVDEQFDDLTILTLQRK